MDVANIPTPDPGPRDTPSGSESEEPAMIGDFDGGANEFWKLYRDEAMSYDKAQIGNLKEGMDSALIFVRSHFSIMDFVMLMRAHRLVYFLLLSLHSLSIANKT